MKMGHLQTIQSFETSIKTGNVQTYNEQSLVSHMAVNEFSEPTSNNI